MNAMSRRQLLCGSGAVLSAPLAASFVPVSAFGQGVVKTSPPLPTKLSGDVQAYATSGIPSLISKCRNRAVTGDDLMDISQKTQLLARHMSSFDLEPFRQAALSAANTLTTSVDLSSAPGVSDLYSEVLKYDPDYPSSEFNSSFIISADDFTKGKEFLSKNTIPGHLYSMADALRFAGKQSLGVVVAPVAYESTYQIHRPLDLVYRPERLAHLELSKFCGMTGKQWCIVGAAVVAAGLGIAAIIAGAELGALSAAVMFTLDNLAINLGISFSNLIALLQVAARIAALIGTLCGVFL